MLKRVSPHRVMALREAWRRIDRIAGDLNVVLVVLAIGLATLDFTFLVTEKIIERLPPVTYAEPASTPPADTAKPAQ